MEHPDAALDRERARGELAGVGIAARHGSRPGCGEDQMALVLWNVGGVRNG
jgi:hypothetical protein